jgi:hypothetical protein
VSAMIRRRRPPYIPAWDDEKQRQAIRSASLCQCGEDLSREIRNEIRHRQQRRGGPGRPGRPNADLEVRRRLARERGNVELEARLEEGIRARRRWQEPVRIGSHA